MYHAEKQNDAIWYHWYDVFEELLYDFHTFSIRNICYEYLVLYWYCMFWDRKSKIEKYNTVQTIKQYTYFTSIWAQ